MSALESLCRDIDTDDLILDIIPKHSHTNYNNIDYVERAFCVSEISPGGLGIIENFLKAYSQDPRNFLHSSQYVFLMRN